MSSLAQKEQFFARIGDRHQIQHVFDYLPGISFFVKDDQSRLMGASRSIIERFGLAKEAELIGTVDHDYFPAHLADAFVRDDQQVIRSGKPLVDRVEIWFTEHRLLDWFVTTKLPLRDGQANVIGVMGVIRSYEGSRKLALPYTQINSVVEYIREHHRGKLTVTQLAKLAGLSTRQLHRKFMDVFGMNVQDFVSKTRIQATCDVLINTDRALAEIASEFGFCDQSAFTQQFRKHIGTTPRKFRREHRM